MSTQKDVAKHAKISIATVSRYINNVGYISPEVKARIQIAIDQLGYKPNLVARSLKINESHIIGLVFPDINNPFFIELIKSAEKAAHALGYNVILCNTQNDPEEEMVYLDMLIGKRADGFIVIPSLSNSPESYSILKNENVVFVDRTCGIENEIHILLDNRFGIEKAVSYLIELGHRRIGSIHVPLNVFTGYERYTSFMKTCEKHGLNLDESLVKMADFTNESAYEKTMDLLNLHDPPTALITMSCLTTIGALRAIREKKVSIPEDISVIGFDEFEYTPLFDPPITTIIQPAKQFGEEAIDLLYTLLQKKQVRKRRTLLKPELIVRDSCRSIG